MDRVGRRIDGVPQIKQRIGHYLLLLGLSSLLFFVNLGGPSLWDIDEGKNAGASREMLESDSWVLPTFNYEPRYEKPALLYWLQMAAYRTFGVDEFAARVPSAVASLAAVIATYELGMCFFGVSSALLGALILATSAATCFAARFANPDALLHACTVLTLLAAWKSLMRGVRPWYFVGGIAAGLGALAKGPVALVLPGIVVVLFLAWTRNLKRLWDRGLILAGAAFVLTALPWYLWVAIDSRGQFLKGFLLKENVGRYLHSMENHGGPIFYYPLVFLLGFAPWSAFAGIAGWFGLNRRANEERETAPYRFLWCWIAVYLVFFSLASTKLPNYILPVYAPAAILTGRFLDRWRLKVISPAPWAARLAVAGLFVMGIGTTCACLIGGGIITLPALRGRILEGLGVWGFLGGLPVLASVVAAWCLRRQQTSRLITVVATTAFLFYGLLGAWGTASLDRHKAPRSLVEMAGADNVRDDVRVGCYQYFQPSLVFYCHRDVQNLENEQKALDFVRCPLRAYLFLPESAWDALRDKFGGTCHVLARHEDMYRHCTVVVVSNR
jgi:4-amino-4-deoxy-L-arabinose transferase-like glycosyltransferase